MSLVLLSYYTNVIVFISKVSKIKPEITGRHDSP